MSTVVRAAAAADASAIARIYNHYVRETAITFEEEQVSSAECTIYLDPACVGQRIGSRLYPGKVAHFKEVGFKFGHRIDVAYWERAL